MNKPPIVSIQMVPAGVELVLAGLNKLPREQSDALYNEIAGQFGFQIQELMKAEQAKEAEEKARQEAAARAAAAAEKAAKKTAKKTESQETDPDPLS